ncbi:hypothetical protein AB6A40_004239 [Gnathostoma spinigerum]|uniref:Ribonuclease P/MRP protein subunit POP5 n=1 Tax=Gnathostoma spinigerum TaxID=75299 RepID=A0ABD6ED13_9BILA
MVKLKFRYLLAEVLVDEPGVITERAIYYAIEKCIADLYGDFGVGAAKISLNVKVCDKATSITVIRISFDSVNHLLAAIPFVSFIDKVPAVLRTLHVGATMRSCEKALIRINREKLYSSLKSAKNEAEKKEILKGLKSVTGAIQME